MLHHTKNGGNESIATSTVWLAKNKDGEQDDDHSKLLVGPRGSRSESWAAEFGALHFEKMRPVLSTLREEERQLSFS